MPRDSLGNYVLPAGNPVVTGTIIETVWANPTLDDIAAELSNSLDRAGRGGMQAPLRIADGTLIAPGLAFVAETRSGLLREGPEQIAFAVNSQSVLRLTPSSVFVVTGAVDTAAGVTISEQGQRVYSPNNPPPGGGETFLTLTDTPANYVGAGGQSVLVNLSENGLEFGPAGSGDFVGPAGASTDALVLFADTTGKLGKESTFTVAEVVRTDVKDQRLRNDFIVTKDGGDAVGSFILERSSGDQVIRLDTQQSNALRGHVVTSAGASAPGGRTLFLNESATRGVVIGQDQVTPAGTYADAGKDTLRVMGPIYESREGDINYRAYTELFPPPTHPVNNVGGGTHNVTLPDTSFDYKFRTFNNDFAVTSDVFSIADNAVTNAKLADVSGGTLKGLGTGGPADPQDLRVDGLANRAPLTTDVLLGQIVGGDLVNITVDTLSVLDTPAYTGTGDARLDMTPAGASRPVKRLVEGANVTLTETTDSVTITASIPGGGGGIVKGTPFDVGQLGVVTDNAGDGEISTSGLVAAQIGQLNQANIWTVSPQTFQSGTSDGGIDVDVTQTPRVRLRSSSGVVDKRDGRVIQTQNGHLDITAYNDVGSPIAAMAEFWNNGGVVLPPAAGGDPGAGNINAVGFLEGGVALRTAYADTFASLSALNGKADNTITLTAGLGLTGGGDLQANRTFDIGAGDGITVAADTVAVNSTVQRQIVGGTNGNLVSRNASGMVQDSGVPQGTVAIGPGSSTTGNVATWSDSGGQFLANSAIPGSAIVRNNAAATIESTVGYAGTSKSQSTPATVTFEPTAGQYVNVTGTGLLTINNQTSEGSVLLLLPDAVSVSASGYTLTNAKPTGRASMLVLTLIGATRLGTYR